ncbi:MAG TPA: alpha/beta hydrolase [Caulobacteraceae bacterium]|jgi:acetyl esterase/lipase
MADPVIEKAGLKGLLSLPRPLLRLLAGGGVVYVGGRTLDPRLQLMAALGRRQPQLSSLTPPEARLATAQALRPLEGPTAPGVAIENLAIPGPDGDVRARAYRPASQDPLAPVLVFAHMGGGVIGDLETCHGFCALLALVARCPVLSVDYRLAPEHRFPAALEDVLSAYRWACTNAGRFGAPAGVAAIGGDSMGGNFAAVACQELRRHGEAQPAFQLLIYPAVDIASETQSMTTYADAWPLSRATMAWFMGHYAGPEDDPADPRLSPIKAADLSGLAPAIVATAGFDPLVDQGEAYAKRLKGAGAPVVYRCYDALAHGFCGYLGVVPAADVACREIAGLVREAIEGRLA